MGEALDDEYSAVLAELDAELAADAQAVMVGVYAGVGLADRLRAAVGRTVAIGLLGEDPGELAGPVEEVATDAVAISHNGGSVVVRLGAISWLSGLPQGHLPAGTPGERRRSMGTLLRRHIAQQVRVRTAGGRHDGFVHRVGADHLELLTARGRVLIPFLVISWVAGPDPGR